MKLITGRSIISIAIGIVISLVLFTFIANSPYIFAIGLVVGVYLAKPSTSLAGGIYGVIIALALSLYLIYSKTFAVWISNDLLGTMINILLLVAFGGLYGAFLVWVKRRYTDNKPLYS
jgi:hypothetical protein